MFRIFSNWGPEGDFPDVGNVLNDDTTGGETGTYEAAAQNKVKSGEQYGAGGTEFTGSLSVTGDTGLFFLKRG